MLIIRDNMGVTIKRRIQDVNHIRIVATQAALFIDGIPRAWKIEKPSGEFSLDDCAELLDELEHAEDWDKHIVPAASLASRLDDEGPTCPGCTNPGNCDPCEYERNQR